MSTIRRALVGAIFLSAAAGRANGQLSLSNDRPLDMARGPAILTQRHASIAFGAGTYLAVWYSSPAVGAPHRILASRVDASGSAIDQPPIQIASQSLGNLVESPAVAFDGANFVVAWMDQVSQTRVKSVHVTPAGAVATTVTDHGIISGSTGPVLASGSGSVLLTWHGGQTPVAMVARVQGSVITATSATGVTWPEPSTYRMLLAGDPMQDVNTSQLYPSSAFGGGEYLVAFVDSHSEGDDVYAVIVQPSGVIGVPQRVPSGLVGASLGASDPAVGFGGGTFFVAYVDSLIADSDENLFGRPVSTAGAPTGSSVTISGIIGRSYSPQVAFGGGSFLVAWQEQDPTFPSLSSIKGTQVDTTGALVRAEVALEPLASSLGGDLLTTESWRATALASDGTNFMMAWTRQSPGNFIDTLGSPISSANIAAAPTPGILSLAANEEETAVATSNGTVHLVVWRDMRNVITSGVDILGQRVDGNGNNLGGVLHIATGSGNQASPAVAAIPGGDFLVAWADPAENGNVMAATVSAGGTVGPTLSIATGSATQLDPTIAGTTNLWQVFWSEGAQIKVSTVAAGGAVGSPMTIGNGAHPSAAFDGTSVLVAYEQGSPRAIVGTWVDANGTPTSNRPTIAAGTLDLDSPSVAAAGGRAIVVWHEPAANNEVIRMAGVTTNQTGTPVGIPVAMLAGRRDSAHVAMSGTRFIVMWNDHRSVSTQFEAFAARGEWKNQPSPTILSTDTNGFLLVDGTPPPETPDPFVSILSDGRALYGYTLHELSPPLPATPTIDAIPRIHATFGGIRGLGDQCDADGGCDSGHCANGLCCETACNGTCQACDANGKCDLAPANDDRCGATDCSGLRTDCLDFDATARCQSFGICRLPSDPAACTPKPRPDGTSCAAIGCTAPMGSCMHGACVCASYPPGTAPPNVNPEFANPGCSVAGHGEGAWFFLLAITLLVLRRRRLAAALALFLFGGCTDDPGGLIVQLGLTGQGAKVDHVRFILQPTSAPGFPMMATSGQQPAGVTVFATDVDGDGTFDEVVDVDKAYIRGDALSIELTPRSGGAFGVGVRAWAIDATGNRFAQAPSQNTTVKPGETPTLRLELACLNPNCASTADATPTVQMYSPANGLPDSPAASVATGRITLGSHADDVVAGFAGSPPGGGPTVLGQVRVFLRPTTNGNKEIVLASGIVNDRFGAAVATGAFNSDGNGDVIVGAPGANGGDGAIYVLTGGDWMTAPMVPTTPTFAGQGHEQLGAALAVADVDGDGKLDIVAGAPFGKTVYIFRKGKPMVTLHEDTVAGFGSAVAATSDGILVGAPEANRVRLYRFSAGNPTVAFEWTSPAGGFGAAVALADVDGDGRSDLVASAPAEGAGVVYLLRATDLTGTVGTVQNAHSAVLRSVKTSPGLARLGAAIAALRGPRGFGDVLGLATPGGETNAYLIGGATLLLRPAMAIDDGMAPVAARIAFAPTEHDVLLTGGDVDGDGVSDLVSVTSAGVQIVKGVAW